MRRYGPIAIAVLWTAGAVGCSYHNVLYNADGLYHEAEAHRLAGRDSLAGSLYVEVTRKTGRALRARPASEWSAQALYLMGRAHLHLGDLRAAQASLDEVIATAVDERLRAGASVYLAMIDEALGNRAEALQTVNRALEGALSPDALAEAHLLRGRLFLASAYVDQGWWDLDRASALDPGLAVEAGLERLRWGIGHRDQERSRIAMIGLFAESAAGSRAEEIVPLVRDAERRWGATGAAALLEGVDGADWDRTARGRLALDRARLLRVAGDTAAARLQAQRVAEGLGDAAAEARLLLASWRLARARDLVDAYGVRGVLLPAGTDPRVAGTLAAVDELEAFAALGLDEPLGWFAAAEVARDRLGADLVARGLFLAYADGAPTEAWAPKALLAALEISPDEGDRAWLRGRLEGHRDSPYVLAAHGGSAAGFEALEEELELRLRELTRR